MAKLVYELNQSLDGYVDHMKIGRPDPALFRHFIERVRGLTGSVYGRGMYEIMRYWEDGLPDWGAEAATSRRCGRPSRSGLCRARCSRSAPTPGSSGMTSRR